MMFSVVIPCRNEVKHIASVLEKLFEQDVSGLEWEIIVADGMSDDGTREVLQQYAAKYTHIRVIDNPKRITAAALNAGIRAARGDIIMRMDAHTEYSPDYMRNCVQVLEASGADNVGGPVIAKGKGYVGRAIAAAFDSPFASGGAPGHDHSYEGLVDTVYLGCWRREVFRKVGLFDETLTRTEDDEFNLRLNRAGLKVYQSPKIRAVYNARPSLSGLWGQYFQYGFWKIPVIRKHRIPSTWRQLVPGAFLLTNLVLPITCIVTALAGSGRWSSMAMHTWMGLLALYGLACIVAAFLTARRHDWRLFPILLFIFPVFQISYGVGFLIGLVYWPLHPPSAVRPGKIFTDLTR
jgi:succinoglycan biosynthesis protein ExoA